MAEYRKRATPIGAADRYAEAEERRQREAFRQLPAIDRWMVHLRVIAVVVVAAVALVLAFLDIIEWAKALLRP